MLRDIKKMCECNHKLLTNLYSLFLDEKYCDLTIKLEDGEIKAHTLVLFASSDYFQRMITPMGTLVINDVKKDEMTLIIEFIYKGNLESQNQNEFPNINELLKRFGLCDENCTEYCENLSTKNLESQKSHVEDDLEKIPASDIVEALSSEDEAQFRKFESDKKNEHEASLSRNILEEAYIAAMDMGLTDTDGVTSADNLDTEKGIKNSLANKRSEDLNDVWPSACTEKELYEKEIEEDVIKTDSFNPDADIGQQKNMTNTSGQEGATEKGLNISVTKNDRTNPPHIVTREKVNDGEISHQTDMNRKRKRIIHLQPTSDIVKGLRSRTNKHLCKTYSEKTTYKPSKRGSVSSQNNFSGNKNGDKSNETISENVSNELGKNEIENSSCVPKTKGQQACPECSHLFKSSKLLAGHRHSKHGVALDSQLFEVHKCKDCDYETLEVHRLASHRATSHSTMRPYVCEWCGKNFKLLGALTMHTNIHTKARKHECPQCNKSFSQHGTMKRHMEEKHQQSHRHNCGLCNFSVQDRVKLIQHKYSVHSQPLPPGYTIYKCKEDGCKFETFRKQIYTGHLNTHKGIQEFSCEVCQKRFASIGNLRSHRMVHKEKSLICPYPGCEFSTQLKNRLVQHTRLIHTHRDEKPHECPFCPYKTAVKGNLLKHQKNIHSAAITQSKGENSVSLKGDNSILMGDNSVVQMSSESILKSLVYSSGNIELYNTTQGTDAASHLLVNGEVIFDTITVLGLQQNTEEKT